MKKILILLLLATIFHGAIAQKSTNVADTIVAGSIEKSCPGGFEAFSLYMKKNVRIPVAVRENN